ncbi:MAG TPA: fumarylacetoacetate hydrolase family protein [Anaerolineae bacterium]|nr:fumarylacetoacetate hydrolase family protein [Anaerolineae bacterium]HQK14290.1 fumarylacetoacetate hydrolase family protein [Anaerolineae bacterium]
MNLTRHHTSHGPHWALDGAYLPPSFNLGLLLELPRETITRFLATLPTEGAATGDLLAPIEAVQEVWAAGVTYLRSRDAREAESQTGDIYTRVYVAERPELFFKAAGWRVVAPGDAIRVRPDSTWDVPEPELTLVINRHGEIVGYCAGNDVSSRSIEGENPLYLPQAKVYNGSCALGPGIEIATADALRDVPIRLEIIRQGEMVYTGEASTSQMKRTFEDLAAYLFRELDFPHGAFLMTGTCLVPPDGFTLTPGDIVTIHVGELKLRNPVE